MTDLLYFKEKVKGIMDGIIDMNCTILQLKKYQNDLKIEMYEIEIDPDEFEETFGAFINEQYSPINIAGAEFSALEILKELDPTHYEQCLSEYVDNSISVSDTEEYSKLEERIEEMDLEIYEIKVSITNAIREIHDLEESMDVFGFDTSESIFAILETYYD